MSQSGTQVQQQPLVGGQHALKDLSVVSMIERRRREAPEAVALEWGDERLTYDDLHRRARALNRELRSQGVTAGDLVAIWADRCPDVVAAMLAAMQLRATYVPIDPHYPEDRIRAILTAASPHAVLYAGRAATSTVTAPPSGSTDISDVGRDSKSLDADTGQLPMPDGADIAYIVFTSGTTGRPKGVMIGHAALANYVAWCASLAGNSGGGVPLFASMGFDHAVSCLWAPLACGDRVVLLPGLWDHGRLFERTDRFTFLKATPSHIRFLERFVMPDYGRATKLLMFGGEVLDADLVRRLADRLKDVRLVNHYGPTEATVGCCFAEFELREVQDLTDGVPIGRPIWNTRGYVVDDALGPAREGELIIGGAGVAAGYLDGDPDSRFIAEHELDSKVERSERAYRTGDIVTIMHDGRLQFVGRNDHEVKVSGHRIDLRELRHHALAVPSVSEAAFVVMSKETTSTIDAFIVPDASPCDAIELKEQVVRALRATMPVAAVPEHVHVVSELVLDPHGKCDYRATMRMANDSGEA